MSGLIYQKKTAGNIDNKMRKKEKMNLPTGTYKLTDNGLKREPEEPKHPIEIMTQGKKFVLQPDYPMYSVVKHYDKTAKEI